MRARTRRRREGNNISPSNLFPSGCTVLDLALSDRSEGGWHKGRIVNIIGDSSAGKTMLAMSTLAEIANDPRFDEYKLYLDDVEHAMSFNIPKLFGRKTASRILAPAYDNETKEPAYSDTAEDFQMHLNDALDEGVPFVYVLDSFDALTDDAEQAKIEENTKAKRKGTKTKGSYGMGKPKMASQILRSVKKRIERSGSLLIIISQTRDNIEAGMFGAKRTRSGGRALKFYSTHEIWMAVVGTIKAKVRGKDKVIGTKVRVKISKNKLTGKNRTVDFTIYYSYGVDDITSNIEWMVSEGFWTKERGKIVAEELDMKGSVSELIAAIEEMGMELVLKQAVAKAWNEIEQALLLERKSKYR